jgi:hypothetical protein
MSCSRQNKPVINRESINGGQLGDLRNQVQALQIELMRQRAGGELKGAAIEALKQGAAGQSAGVADYLQALAAGAGATAEAQLLRDRIHDLEARHEQAKKAVLDAESNVVQLSESYLNVSARLRGLVHRMHQARATVEAIMARPEPFKKEHFSAVLAALPSEAELMGSDDQEFTAATPAFAPVSAPADTVGDTGSEPSNQVVELQTAHDRMALDLAAARDELKEAHSDLARDERIFDEKMREIEQLETTVAHIKAEAAADKAAAEQHAAEAAVNRVDDNTQELQPQPQILGTPARSTPNPADLRTAWAQPSSNHIFSDLVNTPHSGRVLASMVEEDDQVLMDDDELYHVPAPDSRFADSAATLGDITELELEQKRLRTEKAAIEEEKSQIESQANYDKRQFHVNKQRLEKTLTDLTVNIQLKEDLIREMAKSEQDARSLQREYESQLADLTTGLEIKQSELDYIQVEFDQFETAAQEKNAEQRRRMRERYESKIQLLQQQIDDAKEAEREQQKLVHANLISDRQIQKMTTAINRMRGQEQSLKLKMREDSDRYVQHQSRKEKEAQNLRREQESFAKRIRELETENAQQKQRLRKKEEELERRKRAGGSVQTTPTRSGRSVGGRLTPARPATAPSTPANRRKADKSTTRSDEASKSGPLRGAGGDDRNGSAMNESREQQARLEAEIENSFKREEAVRRLEKELAQREAAIHEKERALAERHALELKRMRSSQVLGPGSCPLSSAQMSIGPFQGSKHVEFLFCLVCVCRACRRAFSRSTPRSTPLRHSWRSRASRPLRVQQS